MRVYLSTALIWLIAVASTTAFEIEEHVVYPAEPEHSVLKIISTADRAAFEPIIRAFQTRHPGVTVDYTITGTTDLMQAIEVENAVFDVAISSAMDLQFKLANDGYTRAYSAPVLNTLPEWISWRDRVFAFTQEPAVLVVSTTDFPGGSAPRTREDLISVIRDNPDQFRGRVGTYDVRRSGFGYLMATQDSRNTESFWRLMEVMGRADAKLYSGSSAMIQDVSSGKLALAYNVLGSYAQSQQAVIDGFEIVQFDDYVNIMLRSALIPQTVENMSGAQSFIDFLLNLQNLTPAGETVGLPPVDVTALQSNSAMRPIRFGPGLLVFLDRLRRENFIKNWESSLLQN